MKKNGLWETVVTERQGYDGTASTSSFASGSNTFYTYCCLRTGYNSNSTNTCILLPYGSSASIATVNTWMAVRPALHLNLTSIYNNLPTRVSVTFNMSPSDFGSVTKTIVRVPLNSAITVNGNSITVSKTTVTAAPLSSTKQYTYSFLGWDNTDGLITESRVVSAIFERTINRYTLSVEAVPSISCGTILGGGTYDYDSSETLISTPSKGYQFACWLCNGEYYSSDLSISVLVTEDALFKAIFIPTQTLSNGIYVGVWCEDSESTTSKAVGRVSTIGYSSTDDTDYIHVDATPCNGYEFAYWKVDDIIITSSNYTSYLKSGFAYNDTAVEFLTTAVVNKRVIAVFSRIT